jgi:P27 family predicted phage terminase small subunit
MRGGPRRNKPAALRVLEGNPGHRPINTAEPTPPPAANLDPPAWLDREAKRCWREVAPVLSDMGVLSAADRNALVLYCQAWSRYRAAVRAMASPPFGDDVEPKTLAEYLTGWAVRVEKAEASVRLLGADFGMNPVARSRLSVAKPAEKVDEMEDLLSGRSRAS